MCFRLSVLLKSLSCNLCVSTNVEKLKLLSYFVSSLMRSFAYENVFHVPIELLFDVSNVLLKSLSCNLCLSTNVEKLKLLSYFVSSLVRSFAYENVCFM